MISALEEVALDKATHSVILFYEELFKQRFHKVKIFFHTFSVT